MLPGVAEERFEIRSRIGAGSFGVVYEAFDRRRNRTVALKVLERISADTVARFKREFRYLAELRHPNLASLYEMIVLGDQWLLSMELIRGVELLEHLAFVELQNSFLGATTPTLTEFDGDRTIVMRKPSPAMKSISEIYVNQVRDAFRQIAIAVAVLHANGVIHRDIKPSNIMITPEGRVVLLDFGLAAEMSFDDSIDRRTVVGTPGYMSPEQVIASTPTPASDWYAFGVLLYQALSGQLPFAGSKALDIVEQQMHGEPPVSAAKIVGGVPEDLSALADACMRRDAAARPSDEEVLARLGITGFDPLRIERTRDRSSELIGRGRELRTLRGYLDALQPGKPRLVLLHASPGTGKTALLDQFLDDLRTTTAPPLILGGRCHAWESMQFNAVDSIVDALAREIRRGKSPEAEEILGRAVAAPELFPALNVPGGREVGEQTIALPHSGEKLVARAVTELRQIIAAVAGQRPVLIVLDDAQWGDYQSAEVFRKLMKGAGSMRLMLLLSYRTEDWRTGLLLQLLLGSGFQTSEIELKPLSRPMTERMLKRELGRANKRLTDVVFRQSRGNPLLIELMSGVLRDGGEADKDLFSRAMASNVSRLSAAARRLFALLLSADSPVREDEAESELELFEVDEPVRTLVKCRLIRMSVTGDLRELNLYHPRMREALRR